MSRLASWSGKYLLLAAALAFPACGKPHQGSSTASDTARSGSPAATGQAVAGSDAHGAPAFDSVAVLRERDQKNVQFLGTDSPIPEENRASFKGLGYFPINPALALDLHLERLATPEPFKMAATRGDVRMMHRVGKFHFTVDSTQCTLTAFTSDEHPDELFVPFRDATSGTESYEAGRYLDIPVRDDDHYLLDFNRAYSPYCAYNTNYTCPVVPTENFLPVAIRAGEIISAAMHH